MNSNASVGSSLRSFRVFVEICSTPVGEKTGARVELGIEISWSLRESLLRKFGSFLLTWAISAAVPVLISGVCKKSLLQLTIVTVLLKSQ